MKLPIAIAVLALAGCSPKRSDVKLWDGRIENVSNNGDVDVLRDRETECEFIRATFVYGVAITYIPGTCAKEKQRP